MRFLEDIAARLDEEGLEAHAVGAVLYVPISTEVEIRFTELDAAIDAATVHVAAAGVVETQDDTEVQALVGVVFSADDALSTVIRHVATDQVVTIVRHLLDGVDDRLAELDFYQDDDDATMVWADVAEYSELCVIVESTDGVPTARVSLHVHSDEGVSEPALELADVQDEEHLTEVLALAARYAPVWERELVDFDTRERAESDEDGVGEY